jgi:hypothetical protein
MADASCHGKTMELVTCRREFVTSVVESNRRSFDCVDRFATNFAQDDRLLKHQCPVTLSLRQSTSPIATLSSPGAANRKWRNERDERWLEAAEIENALRLEGILPARIAVIDDQVVKGRFHLLARNE